MNLDKEINKYLSSLNSNLVDNILMIILVNKAKAYVVERVQQGEYLEGSSTNASEYSGRPSPIPYGLFVKLFGKRFAKNLSRGKSAEREMKSGKSVMAVADQEDFKIFRSKSGKTMVLIKGGYRRYRELRGLYNEHVVESWTGRMMRNLGILRADKTKGELGFSSADEYKKAYYQHEGSGKNKVKHIFMGLTEKELTELGDLAETLILQNLK